jgi:hypothetical protein
MSRDHRLADMKFCRAELNHVFMPDEALTALCLAHGSPFIADGPAALTTVCARIEEALRANAPLSLLRVGNGEGNAIGMTKDRLARPQKDTFFQAFNSQNGVPVPLADAIRLCVDVRSALSSADIIGFRCFRVPERAMIENAIADGNTFAALGFLYAREFLQDGLVQEFLSGKFITSAWIHLDLIPSIDRLFALSERIIVITGRAELGEQMRVRLGSKLKDFIAVPVQGIAPSSAAKSHYYEAYPKVVEYLNRDLRGTLVLVGAGLFGKIYCNVAKLNGGVAVDLGSAFDVLAGRLTRPAHARYDFSNANWL